MNRIIKLVAVLAAGLWFSPLASAAVADTVHNLGSTGTGTNTFSGTTEICVFCHTPHGGDSSASVPLWNRTLAAPSSYTTYDTLGTSSLDGATGEVGSVSIACLSCHDGTQAMDLLINDPGSGGTITTGTWGTGVWSGTGTLNATDSGVAFLDSDLTNDHPIGIQYGGGGITDAAPTGATTDSDFVAPKNTTVNGQTVWWVDTTGGTADTREKTDMLLYTRTDVAEADGVGTISGTQPFVECASCHDPHSTNATFLRISNASSGVCLACHTK